MSWPPKNSAAARWLAKKVQASRVLDDMSDPGAWTAFTTGAPEVVDARTVKQVADRGVSAAEIEFTRERSRKGRPCLRMRLPARLEGPGPANGRGWGSAGVRRRFAGEDWSGFNRLSLWIFPDCPGFHAPSLEWRLFNEGTERLPAAYGQEGETTVMLRNHEWNHVVWEIGNVARDRVTCLEISALMCGHEREASPVLAFDLDLLDLERVEPDHVEGWNVWPGRLAYCHAGYRPEAVKRAIATGLGAKTFRVVDAASGEVVLNGPVRTDQTPLGPFQVLDFSAVNREGTYVLEAAPARTPPFRIGSDAWQESLDHVLGFIRAERCGTAVPGVHGVCHADWSAVHGDRRIIINGGWHDAGDLTQGLDNTGEILYNLLALLERLRERGGPADLRERVADEARWGLEWVLKTSFGGGFRNQGSVNSRWTDGILGTSDDVTVAARQSVLGSFTAAAAEALAARVLRESEPDLAARALAMAEEDWGFGRAGMEAPKAATGDPWRVTFDSAQVELEPAAMGALASLELWRATGKETYAEAAAGWARVITASQERTRPDWDVPLFGWFYTGPDRQRVLHYCHRGRDHVPILALTGLCEALPDHPDWMSWYATATWYGEYLKAAAAHTEPFGVLPASIYRDDEHLSAPPERQAAFRAQVMNGVPLGKGRYLRRFPVWMNYRGHFGMILPQAQALLAIARLRGDCESAWLAERQAAWVLGNNPFGQSVMVGVGQDFTPLYAPLFGDIAGSLPVGFQTRGDADEPYWPVQSTWTYKEVWVHPGACWIGLMRDLDGPAVVEGEADEPIEFVPEGGGAAVTASPVRGRFLVELPEGRYAVRCGEQEREILALPAGRCTLNLRADNWIDFKLKRGSGARGEVQVKLTARGRGDHRLSIRAENLQLEHGDQEVVLSVGRPSTLEWRGRVLEPDRPWIVVVTADGNPACRSELMARVGT